jgi:arylsulfatase A-like enzyme
MTLGLLSILAFCLAPDGSSRADAVQPPHVVFVLADDLGPGDVGCSGGTLAATPNLDRMARDGVRFTRYYSAAPICSPSRCGLITGCFPARWRLTSYLQTRAGNRACGQVDFLDPHAPSLPRVLRDAGYRTAHFGKWHLGGGRDVTDAPPFAAYGYEEHAGTWESPEPHPDITATNAIWSAKDKAKRWERTGFYVDKALDFLARHKDRPCFVNVWLDDPHTPWVPDAAAGQGASTARNLKAVMEEVDRQIGRLREGLKALGIEQSTLLIFTSDNGPLPTLDGRRSSGLRGSKLSLYEGGIRLPFFAVWPGMIPAGATDDTTVFGAVDVFPTICKLAGTEPPAGTRSDGEDRSPALLGTPQPGRARPLYWEYGRNDTSFDYPTVRNGARRGDRSPNLAVRDGRWKLLVNADGTGAELYDLPADPAETKDLAATHPEQVTRLTKLLLEWRKSLP